MPFSLQDLKAMREKITPEWIFEKGRTLPGSIPSPDALLIASAPSILDQLIQREEERETVMESRCEPNT